MDRIDAHQHFWRYDPARFGWIDPAGPLARDALPADLQPLLERDGIHLAIAVQAEQTAEETDWLLALAARHDWIAGVVGWIDLAAEDVAEQVARRAAEARFVGVRHIVQDEPDGFLLRDEIARGIRTVGEASLTYDILVRARQLPEVRAFLDRAGGGRFVLDHAGKPPIAEDAWQPWADDIARVAELPHVWCKVSGLVTEANHGSWRAEDLHRYLGHVLACFGPERLIFGSDWPVCTLAASYAEVHAVTAAFVAAECPDHAEAVFGGNAARAYALV